MTLPLDVNNFPWLYECKNDKYKSIDVGKWMLFYDKSLMNEAWVIAKRLYREDKLHGVTSMKCSTAFENSRASMLDEGVIILYCNNSSNEEMIMNIGKNIIEMFNYKEKQYIYYKTDLQTREGTVATGCKKNHTYKLCNKLNKGKFLFKLQESNPILQIERTYPTKKLEKTYINRYDEYVFQKLNEMNGDAELQSDYKKWKNGINYKTNRKIKINGKIHRELEKKFIIHGNSLSGSWGGAIMFDNLNHIDKNEYLQETKKLNNEVDRENSIINEYNIIIDSVIEKIKKLEKWDDFIVFEGKQYGIPCIFDNIHRENDCFGDMVFTCKKIEVWSNDRPFCICNDVETTYSIYKCSKCNYENKIMESRTGGGNSYVSNVELCLY